MQLQNFIWLCTVYTVCFYKSLISFSRSVCRSFKPNIDGHMLPRKKGKKIVQYEIVYCCYRKKQCFIIFIFLFIILWFFFSIPFLPSFVPLRYYEICFSNSGVHSVWCYRLNDFFSWQLVKVIGLFALNIY